MVENALLHGDVQRGGRLVGDQQIRAAGQADGDQRTLAHAAGELMRELAGTGGGVGQTSFGQQSGNTVLHRGAQHVLLGDRPCGVVRNPRVNEVLGHTPTRLGARNPLVAEIVHFLFDMLGTGIFQSLLGGVKQSGQILGADEQLVLLGFKIHHRVFLGGQRRGQLGTLLLGNVHVVGLQGLFHLSADTPHRIEVRHRVLRHQAHLGATELVVFLLADSGDFLAVQFDGAADDMAGAGQQAEHRHGGGGLAGA